MTNTHQISPAQLYSIFFRAGVIIAVALQEVDNAPNAKSSSESDNKCLQNAYCAVEKCHKKLLSAAVRLARKRA